ncbi:uncharacterized protein LOC122913312 [Neovison vison]|uniref:uncharacterized protein LOC122913312 n=1 Tax=Neovison vison TaxID=452646 RepID=UPI001CF0BC52|nr:uncharacterized protein LOC122913312 [Neogale vison]
MSARGALGRVLGTTSPSGPCGPDPVPVVGVGRDADLSLRAWLHPEDVLGTLTGQSLGQFGIPAGAQGTVAQSGHRSRDREKAPAPRALPTCAPHGRRWCSALCPSAPPPVVPACAPRTPRRPARLRRRQPESALLDGWNPACRVPRRGAASRAGEEYRRGNHHLVPEWLSAEGLCCCCCVPLPGWRPRDPVPWETCHHAHLRHPAAAFRGEPTCASPQRLGEVSQHSPAGRSLRKQATPSGNVGTFQGWTPRKWRTRSSWRRNVK